MEYGRVGFLAGVHNWPLLDFKLFFKNINRIKFDENVTLDRIYTILNITFSTVYDKHKECPAWSAMDECKKSNWTWMVDHCPRSCDVPCKWQFSNQKGSVVSLETWNLLNRRQQGLAPSKDFASLPFASILSALWARFVFKYLLKSRINQ